MKLIRVASLFVAFVAAGCGGGGGDDNGGTTGPPPPGGGTQTLGSITTNVSSLNVGAGNTSTVSVTAYDVNNQVISTSFTPTFTSSAPAIAEVDGNGTVLGISSGNAVITASLSLGGVTRTATVDVSVTGELPQVAAVTASSGDFLFLPNLVAIARGGTVTWTFGGLEHNVTFASTSGAPAGIGNSYSTAVPRTFGSSGNFNYQCTIHPGMNGRVIVR
jgi:plastocyanin